MLSLAQIFLLVKDAPYYSLTDDFAGKAHLKEALLQHEEALRVNRMCRELRKKDALHDVLRLCHDRCLDKYADVDDEDDFSELLEPPPILPGTTFQLTLAYPDFSRQLESSDHESWQKNITSFSLQFCTKSQQQTLPLHFLRI